jgi:glycosyltransferase involved in cell wall biosynthesis
MEDKDFILHNILPPNYYKIYLKLKSNRSIAFLINIITYLLIYIRLFFFLLLDIIFSTKVIIISRGLFPRFFPFFPQLFFSFLLSKSCVIWDFDDDILFSKEISRREFDFLSSRSRYIIVTHDYLKQLLNPRCQDKVIILPTTDGDFQNLDIDKILETRLRLLKTEVHIVWVGTAVNLPLLEKAIVALDHAVLLLKEKYNKKIILNIVSSQPLKYTTLSHLTINYIKCSKEVAICALENRHIGIMPLDLTEYSLGKGGFKLVQYMAIGLPVIASNVGFNTNIVYESFGELLDNLDDSEKWCEAIYRLTSSESIYILKSKRALKEWKERFSFDYNLQMWSEILKY